MEREFHQGLRLQILVGLKLIHAILMQYGEEAEANIVYTENEKECLLVDSSIWIQVYQ